MKLSLVLCGDPERWDEAVGGKLKREGIHNLRVCVCVCVCVWLIYDVGITKANATL